MSIDHQYEIYAQPDALDIWTTVRLPFEPRGSLAVMRNQIREELRRLPPADALYARLTGDDGSRFDVENVLFYNIGCSPFRNITRRRLVFERAFSDPARRDGRPFSWHHRYTTRAVESLWSMVSEGVVVSATGTGRLPRRAIDFWLAASQSQLDRQFEGPPLVGRMLGAVLHVQCNSAPNPTEIVKPMLDGLLSSLHRYEGTQAVDVAERASRFTGEPQETLHQWLKSDGPLGPARFVWLFRNGLQWSPSDDRLVSVAVNVTQQATPQWRAELHLYTVAPK